MGFLFSLLPHFFFVIYFFYPLGCFWFAHCIAWWKTETKRKKIVAPAWFIRWNFSFFLPSDRKKNKRTLEIVLLQKKVHRHFHWTWNEMSNKKWRKIFLWCNKSSMNISTPLYFILYLILYKKYIPICFTWMMMMIWW